MFELTKNLKYPGLLQDQMDPRDVWADEILGGEVALPAKYLVEELEYERQFSYPFCVSFAVTTATEHAYKRKTGQSLRFSQPHLFFRADGTMTGSGFRANLDVGRKLGLINYNEMPVLVNRPKNWHQELRDQAFRIPFKDPRKIGNYVRIQPDPEKLKAAIMQFGPILVGVNAKGNYYKGNASREGTGDNHAVLLVGWNERSWIIFDSLAWVGATAGYGALSLNYTFNSAYAITELPDNWKEIVAEVRSEPFEDVLNHYGKERDLKAEQDFADKMLIEFKKFNNQSVLDAAGRFWTVLVNAGTYGGYSLSYNKWGMWHSGDIINDIYNWRRTGEHIFDFNQPRV